MSASPAEKKPVATDWHKADIVAALHKAGWSLAQLSVANGRGRTAVQNALHRPYPKSEAIIAKALGVRPQDIWPSRYDSNGRSNRPMGRRPLNGTQHPQSVAPSRGTRNVSRKDRG